MGLDIRKPIGILFVILGAQLVGWGLIGGGEVSAGRALGFNVNLWWGALLAVTGGISLALSARSRR